MKSSLPCLSAFTALLAASAALAQPSSAALPASSPPSVSSGASQAASAEGVGDRLLSQAINQLEHRRSVTARLRHQVSLAGEQFYGVGSYWQQGSADELRVRLELQIAGQETSLLQVSNSRFLWIDRRLPTGRTVTRIDLRQLRVDPVLGTANFDEIRPGEASWSPVQPELTAHCGGLPSLLAALGENFSFLPPQAMRLALAPPIATQPASVPVFAVVGHWRREKLAMLVEGQESRVESQEPEASESQQSMLDALPDRLPQEVLLLVGQADFFPYRIEYRRLETPQAADKDTLPIPYQLSANPLVVLELSDVVFDVPIAAGQFDYAPQDVNWVDQTAALLERLRRERQQQLAIRSSTQSVTPRK